MLRIRNAHQEDCLDIHKIRNEEEIRKFSFDTSEITFENHRSWFEKTLVDDKRRLFVVTEENQIYGVVRFDLSKDLKEAEVSIYVSKTAANKGVGKFALLESEKLLKNEIASCKKIIAKALIDNERSIQFFKNCAYQPMTLVFEKEV